MNLFVSSPDFSRLKRILVIRQDRLGDLILSLPLIDLIHSRYPTHKIDFLVPEYTRDIASAYQGIHQVICLPQTWNEREGFELLLSIIRKENYDLVLVPNTKSRIAELVWKAGIPYRIGQGFRLHGWRYNLPVFQSRKMPTMNELDYNFNLLSRWFPQPEPSTVKFNLIPPAGAVQQVQEYLREQGIAHYSIIHPGSGGSAIDISPEKLGQLIREYTFPGAILLTGSASEAELVRQVLTYSGGKGINCAGKFSLSELMALIQGCALFIGNSTGPLHLARAFERPLLGFYSSIPPCHPKRWGPYGKEAEQTLLPPEESYTAFERDKEKSRENMSRLSLDVIKARLDSILGRRT